MALKIRLARGGSKKRPFYRIVVAEATSPRDGRFVDRVGSYNPLLPQGHAERIVLNTERIQHWLSVGAQPTDRVEGFLSTAGLVKAKPRPETPKKSAPKKKSQDRTKEAAELAAAPVKAPEPVAEVEVAVEEVAVEEVAVDAVAEEVAEAVVEEVVVEAAAEEVVAEEEKPAEPVAE